MKKVKNNVIHFLPRWDNGGMEHIVLDIISHFQNTDNEYSILTAFKESEYGMDRIRKCGIKFSYIYYEKEYSFKCCYSALRKYFKSEKCDILHCHVNNSIGLLFAVAAKLSGVKKVIIHTHNNSFGNGYLIVKKILRMLCIMLFGQLPELYLACSDDAGKWSFGRRACKSDLYHVVYNGIDIDRFRFDNQARDILRKRYGLSEKYIIGHIGHFNYQKNQEFLLESAVEIIKKIPDVHYFFIGSGETKSVFEENVKKIGIESHVTIIEPVNDPQSYYSMFDLFVFPSLFEGFGLVMVEAQINGLSIICSENVPSETDITGKVSFLTINGKESSSLWTEAVLKAKMQNNMTDRFQKINCSKYDIRYISNQIENYYSVLLEKK